MSTVGLIGLMGLFAVMQGKSLHPGLHDACLSLQHQSILVGDYVCHYICLIPRAFTHGKDVGIHPQALTMDLPVVRSMRLNFFTP